MYHGGKIFLEFLGDTKGSDQIIHFQSAEVGDEILSMIKFMNHQGLPVALMKIVGLNLN